MGSENENKGSDLFSHDSARGTGEGRPRGTERAGNEPIAIVGMACRLPTQIDGPSSFWTLLVEGRHGITEVPPERWNLGDYFDPDPSKPGKISTRYGGFLDQIDQFDAAFFGISRREADSIDPQQRLLLELSWEALENAAIDPAGLSGTKTGVFVGISTSDYMQMAVRRNNPALIDAYSGTGTGFSVAAGRLSYTLGLQGPSLALDTACSSSLVGVHLACQSLRTRESDLALAGGVNAILQPDTTISFSRARMMAADGRCKSFDAAADGYVRGEGCGVVVLKRLSDARRDGDRVLAMIRGSAVNQDGRSNGLTAPNGQAQEAVIRAALADGGLGPSEVDYVEAHGTGTPLGDPIEVRALARVFAPGRSLDRPLLIGSVKTNIGHLEAAAGVAGLIKVVLSLQQRQIPPHLHFQRPSPHVDWEHIPVRVVSELTAWDQNGERRRVAGVSSFGFAGTNAHVILEEAPVDGRNAQGGKTDRPLHLVILSARSQEALRQVAERHAGYLGAHPDEALADFAHTAAAGRSHFSHRLALVSKTTEEVREKLGAVAAGRQPPGVTLGRVEQRPGVAFLFTGQGSQYPGMARQLYESQPYFAEILDRCEKLLRGKMPRPLFSVLWGAESGTLDETAHTQPALFAVEYALAELWRSWGIEPSAMLGHSVGEYVAACIAGVFSLEEGLELIARRGTLMQELPRCGGMAALIGDAGRVESLLGRCGEGVSIAAVNGPGETVISGTTEGLEKAVEEGRKEGLRAQLLPVSHAFHSAQMDPMLGEFQRIASRLSFSAPQIPIVSSVSGAWIGEAAPGADYWSRQIRQAVQFLAAMRTLDREGYGVYLEIGPQPTLSAMGRRCVEDTGQLWLPSLRRGREDWQQMLESLALLYTRGVEVDWKGFDRGTDRKRLALPTYPFQRQRYWVQQTEAGRPQPPPSARQAVHPLLGSRVSAALTDRLYESDLSGEAPHYLKDHRVYGSTVLPAAAYVEIGFAAGRQLWGDAGLAVEDLVIEQPLLLPGPRRVQLVLTPEQEGRARFQLYLHQAAETPGGKEGWIRQAGGQLRRLEQSTQEGAGAQELARWRQECPEALSAALLYQHLADQGLEYGPSFRGVEQLWRGQDQILGRLRLPASLGAGAADHHLHPVLLDSCFQLLAAALPESRKAGYTYLPASAKRVELGGKPGTVLWSHVRAQMEGPNGSAIDATFTLYDEGANVVARVAGLKLRQIRRESWLRLNQPLPQRSLYRIEWRPQPLQGPPADPSPGRWLIFADRSGVGDALAGLLRTDRNQPKIIYPGEIEASDSAYGKLLAQEPDLCGVLFLWGLDAGASDVLEPGSFDSDLPLTRSAFHLLKAVAARPFGQTPRFWVVTRGSQAGPETPRALALGAAPLWGLTRTVAAEHPELSCVCVDLDPAAGVEQAAPLRSELNASGEESQVLFRGAQRYVARLAPSALEDDSSECAASEGPVRLEVPETGVLDDLALRPMRRQAPQEGEVEIEVRATGLNFRDVLNALGLYPGDAGPLGGECSGTIAALGSGVDRFQIGQEVISIAAGSFSSFVTTHSLCVWPKPKSLSFEEAATIPITFLTAYYGLCRLGKLSSGDRVLIHAAAGGVGLAAVQLARRAGAEIYATASPPKWETLRALGVKQIMNSRSLDFADQIMESTQGRGVTMVLNSLSGEYIPKSLAVLAQGGRFLEIGKREIWTLERVAALRPDVSYFAYDLAELIRQAPVEMNELLATLLREFEEERLRPLPHTTYPIKSSEAAFRLMAQGKNIGKVVISQGVAARTPTESRPVRPDRTYIITGGLGALGLQVSRWMVQRGARSLLLIARSSPSETAREALAQLATDGIVIRTVRADVSNYPELRTVFNQQLGDLPPLGGIVHAAGVLADGLLLQMEWKQFSHVMAPKAAGALNLHLLTREMPLDFFVLFSSVVSILGSPGQSNYAAANTFLDALAHHRHAAGLPATSINWGPWDESGMATRVGSGRRDFWASRGLHPIAPDRGLKLLGRVLETGSTQVGVVQVDWPKFLSQMAGDSVPPLLSEVSGSSKVAEDKEGSRAQRLKFLEELRNAPQRKRKVLLVTHLLDQLRRVLGLGPGEPLDAQQSLSSLGMDSLMAVELRARLQTSLGCSLPATMAFEYPNIEAIAEYLATDVLRLNGGDPTSQQLGEAAAVQVPSPSIAIGGSKEA